MMSNAEMPVGRAACVRLELPQSQVAIAIARSVVRRSVTFRDDDAESSFLVALTEIIANALEEHERRGLTEPIVVELVQYPADAVRVRDAGGGIVSSMVDNIAPGGGGPTTDEVPQRGRGLALARAFVVDIDFETTDSGTVVTLPLVNQGIVR